jgi:hypothetical protein
MCARTKSMLTSNTTLLTSGTPAVRVQVRPIAFRSRESQRARLPARPCSSACTPSSRSHP